MPARSLVVCLTLLAAAGCNALEDNGTHLAAALDAGASGLRASRATETVVRYEPLDGPNEPYDVEITPSYGTSGQTTGVWSSYLVVSGHHSGGTSAHNRSVFVPARLYIEKTGGETQLVLRKDGDRISVVDIR